MESRHFSNIKFDLSGKWAKLGVYFYSFIALVAAMTVNSFSIALLTLAMFIGFAAFSWLLLKKSLINYTLTSTHFQQHLFKGGWVLKWNNISQLSLCHFQYGEWNYPLPWIGIRIKDYQPYLDSICPRIIADILLEQRSLLYTGLRQKGQVGRFEDLVLDETPFVTPKGTVYKGLLAMMANRMRYQREVFGFDIFISTSDLGQDKEAFIGLTRRYLAAAEPIQGE
jgi:hypothetical protein